MNIFVSTRDLVRLAILFLLVLGPGPVKGELPGAASVVVEVTTPPMTDHEGATAARPLVTVSLGGTTADFEGADAIQSALPLVLNGGEIQVLEQGIYNPVLVQQAKKLTIKGMVEGVVVRGNPPIGLDRFGPEQDAAAMVVQSASTGPLELRLENLRFDSDYYARAAFVVRGGNHATTLTAVNCTFLQTSLITATVNGGDAFQVLAPSFAGANVTVNLNNSTLQNFAPGTQAGDLTTTFRQQAFAVRGPAQNIPVLIANLTDCYLDSVAGYPMGVNVGNNWLFNVNRCDLRSQNLNGRSSGFRIMNFSEAYHNTTFTFSDTKISGPGEMAIHHPLGTNPPPSTGNRWIFNRCTIDARRYGQVHPNNSTNPTIDIRYINNVGALAGPANMVEIYNSIIYSHPGTRCISIGGNTVLRMYHSTLMNEGSVVNNTGLPGTTTVLPGGAALSTVGGAEVLVNNWAVANSIFLNLTDALLPGIGEVTGNMILGSVDDVDAGGNRIFVQHSPPYSIPSLLDQAVIDPGTLASRPGSPVANAGDPAAHIAAAVGGVDRLGKNRDTQPDIGAYETIPVRIISPPRSGTIVEGDVLRLRGDGISDVYFWDFGDNRSSILQNPGLIGFATTGTQTVTLYTLNGQSTSTLAADTRELTVVPDSPLLPDLRVVLATPPAVLPIGQTVGIGYSVRNDGGALAATSRLDAVYLSEDPELDLNDIQIGSRNVMAGMAADEDQAGTITVTVPVAAEGMEYLIVVVDDEWQIVDRQRLNNEWATVTGSAVPVLTAGVEQVIPFSAGRIAHYFKMEVGPGQNLMLDLETGVPGLQVFARFGGLPDLTTHDYRSETGSLIIPAAAAGTWYVLVYGDPIPVSGSYSIKFESESLSLLEVTPHMHGSTGTLELTLTGAGFSTPMAVELISFGPSYSAANVSVDSFTRITAQFGAGTVQPGTYNVRVTGPTGESDALANALQIVAGGHAQLKTTLVLPSRFGYHRLATIYVEYTNEGTVAMPAPLLTLTAAQNGRQAAILTMDESRLSTGFWTTALPPGFSNTVQFLASGAVEGVLQPGETGRTAVYYAGWQKPWDTATYPPIHWTLGALNADNPTLIDWSNFAAGMRPDYVTPEAWEAIWGNFIGQAGGSWGSYVGMLSANAAYLGRIGQKVSDAQELMALSFRRADGLNPLSELEVVDDIEVQAPGMPITFRRAYAQAILRRYQLGSLGRGWSHEWQIFLSTKADGSVSIGDMSGTPRIFQPDIRDTNKFVGAPDDSGVLTPLAGGAFSLREKDGLDLVFRSDGRLDHVKDPNNHRITCGYSGGSLVSLTHNAGPSLQVSYHANGRISRIEDQSGRHVDFNYDGAGEHLVSATSVQGLTTAYSYSLGNGAAREHALTAIAYAGGSHRYFAYDAQGRLISTQRDGGAEIVTFAYPANGTVVATNALNDPTTYFMDHWGRVAKVENPQGDAVHYSFNKLNRLISATDAGGRSVTFGYDTRGNLIRATDPLMNTARWAYAGSIDRLTSIADPKGNGKILSYDFKGNLLSIAHMDGSFESWTHDAAGIVTSLTNRRGNATPGIANDHRILYQHDARGRLTRKTYADASTVDYVYDARGNLVQALDAQGPTLFTYNANDFMTRVDFPSGQWLTFAYNSAGRRNSIQNQAGHRLNYFYDAAGRLTRLTDEANAEVVRYDYDAAGRIAQETLGNGNITEFTYDSADQLTILTHRRADNTVIAHYECSYDTRGRRIGLQTPDGQWFYEYDDAGRITRTLLESTNPQIVDQDLTYAYDTAGNRLHTESNGTREDYTVNNLNLYTRVGSRTLAYDADGNLAAVTPDTGDSTTIGYDDENRPVQLIRGADSWNLTYNALGGIGSIETNGVLRELVADPGWNGSIVGEYEGAVRIAHYDYGFGPLARVNGSGVASYYLLDPVGGIAGMTNNAGVSVNRYAFDPFGIELDAVEATPNPFGYFGENALALDGEQWLVNERLYDGVLGRYVSGSLGRVLRGVANPYSRMNGAVSSENSQFAQWSCGWQKGRLMVHPPAGGRRWNLNGGGPNVIGGPNAAELLRNAQLGWNLAVPPELGANERAWGKAVGSFCGWTRNPVMPPMPPVFELPPASTEATSSVDPNAKTGPAGIGAGNYVPADLLLPYRIDFENDAAANAAAQVVTISDHLGEALDLATFELTEVGFGDQNFAIPPGRQHHELTVPLTVDNYGFDLRIEMGIRLDTGEVFAIFECIDPQTGLPPAADVGFLPPEDGNGAGQGHLTYVIRARSGLPSGTAVRNVATIQFDYGEVIRTNQVDPHDPAQGNDPAKEALVTLDAGPPTSQIDPLPAVTGSTMITVRWNGSDDFGGSGIAGYDIYARRDSGPWTLWLEGTTQTSAFYPSEIGHTYSFYSLAVDRVGHRESAPTQADATTLRVQQTGVEENTWMQMISP